MSEHEEIDTSLPPLTPGTPEEQAEEAVRRGMKVEMDVGNHTTMSRNGAFLADAFRGMGNAVLNVYAMTGKNLHVTVTVLIEESTTP